MVLLTEYGPAVAGLAASSGLLDLLGRMGATERPPRDAVGSRCGRVGAVSEDVGLPDAAGADLVGENVDIAEPGRVGMLLLAICAFFCAIIVSLKEGRGGPVVLLENPRPGRELTAAAFFGAFGFSEEFSSNLFWVGSRSSAILKVVSYDWDCTKLRLHLHFSSCWPYLGKGPVG